MYSLNGIKNRYQLKSIDPTGGTVQIIEVLNPVLTKKLEVGKRVPEFSFVNIENQKEDLKKYKKATRHTFSFGMRRL